MKMVYVIESVEELKSQFPGEQLRCLEIGTIRSYDENHESTRRIGEALGSRGSLFSVDISDLSLAVSRDICRGLTNITWIKQDSIEFLDEHRTSGEKFHFIFLDGVNDSYYTYQEFSRALNLLEKNGIIIVDDAGVAINGHIPDNTHPNARKGVDIYSHLPNLELDFLVLQTVQGTQLKIINRKRTAQKAISIIGWRRPGYLQQVLTALRHCTGVENYEVLLSIDGGYPLRQEEMRRLVKESSLPIQAVFHHQNLGCSGNTFYALNWAFANPHIDQIIHLEDDVVPSKNFLVFMEACLDHYREDPTVFTISGYHRRELERLNSRNKYDVGLGDEQLTVKRSWFTPWGWGTWRYVWNEVRDGWFGMSWDLKRLLYWRIRKRKWSGDPEGKYLLKVIQKTDKGTWDIPFNQYWRRGRYEIAPDVSHTQNIGSEDGMGSPRGQWHYNNQYTPVWLDDGRHTIPSRYTFVSTDDIGNLE